MRRTKIVCTLGPAVDAPGALEKLLIAGMDVARFNFSHGTHEQHATRFHALREASARLKKPVAVLQDLCGPKVRLGDVAPGTVIVSGQEFILDDDPSPGDARRAPLPVPELRAALKSGDRLLLDDGLLELGVREASPEKILCDVIVGGPLGARKGVAAPGVAFDVEALTEKDIEDVLFGLELGVDFVALSFVRSPRDVARLREAVQGRVPVLVKIEKAEALDCLDEILDLSDGAMVARGDLGVELPIEEVAMVQKRVITACNLRGKPVITATQMLDSMIRNPRPTRAEVTDISNAILDGTDALMLSGETAVGAYPLEATAMMARIACVTERDLNWDAVLIEKQRLFGRESVTDAVADAVATIAHDQSAAAIVCATSSGATARAVAKFRPRVPILAAATDERAVRRLALLWGVTPRSIPPPPSLDALLRALAAAASAEGLADGQLVVLTSGTPVGVPGTTNLIKVHTLGQPL